MVVPPTPQNGLNRPTAASRPNERFRLNERRPRLAVEQRGSKAAHLKRLATQRGGSDGDAQATVVDDEETGQTRGRASCLVDRGRHRLSEDGGPGRHDQ